MSTSRGGRRDAIRTRPFTTTHRQQARSERLSTQTPGFALGLEECQDVANADGALDVADDRTVLVVKKINPHLGNTTTATGAAEDHGNLSQLDGLLHRDQGGYEQNTSTGLAWAWGKR